MKRLITIITLLAQFTFAEVHTHAIPVSIQAQAAAAVFKKGEALPMSITLTNGLSTTIGFTTFAVEPNDWNGETLNVSLVDVYRNKLKKNLYYARPEPISPPVEIACPTRHQVKPSGTFTILIDINKWDIQGGWETGEYELVFRMDGISVDDKISLSVLSDPVHVLIQ